MEEHKFQSAFTVDVECGLSLAMRESYGVDMKPTDRVVSNTDRILELLSLKGIKGTFFILGSVAEHYPELVKRIAADGHEPGVHGYYHYEFSLMTESEAFTELDRAKKLIEDLTGCQVRGHRAPAFSINEKTKWGLDVIRQVGFEYDSSVMPIKSARYGWPGFGDQIRRIDTPDGHTLIEAPLTTSKLLYMDIPASGGRYFQILPYSYLKRKMKAIERSRPFIFYMHPYEIDTTPYPDFYQSELKKAGLRKKIRTKIRRLNRGKTFSKLERLTSDFSFVPLYQIIAGQLPEITLSEEKECL